MLRRASTRASAWPNPSGTGQRHDAPCRLRPTPASCRLAGPPRRCRLHAHRRRPRPRRTCQDESCSRYCRRRADTEDSTAMATMAGGGPTAASACRTTFSILDMFLLIRLIQVASASGHHRQKLNLLQVQ